jgi:hypothetical protein
MLGFGRTRSMDAAKERALGHQIARPMSSLSAGTARGEGVR